MTGDVRVVPWNVLQPVLIGPNLFVFRAWCPGCRTPGTSTTTTSEVCLQMFSTIRRLWKHCESRKLGTFGHFYPGQMGIRYSVNRAAATLLGSPCSSTWTGKPSACGNQSFFDVLGEVVGYVHPRRLPSRTGK